MTYGSLPASFLFFYPLKAIVILLGQDSGFTEEYKRGDGRLSREFERQLARRTAIEIRALANLPVGQPEDPFQRRTNVFFFLILFRSLGASA